MAHCPPVVNAARRIAPWFFLTCLAVPNVLASGARAQLNSGAPPATVPAVLGTRDPSSVGPGRSRESFAVITKPAKPPAQVVGPGGGGGAGAAGSGGPFAHIKVQGLTGTLNKGDVHQTMEAQQHLFDACIQESRRSVRWVSGSIKYAFKVNGEGRIFELRPVTSTIGHRALEQCLTTAIWSTQFPKPAGRATAEFNWGMSVEPLSARAFTDANPKLLKRIARKQARDVFGTCEIRRRRARFRVTAYFNTSGKMLSSGAVPLPATAEDKVDCVLEQLEKWHIPKLKKASKITFDLR